MHTQNQSPVANSFCSLFMWVLVLVMGATNAVQANPALTVPADGAKFSGNSLTFEWNANGADISAYALTVGSTAGGSDLHDSGELSASTLSDTVTGIGGVSTLHIRLWTRSGDGLWTFRQSTAVAGTGAVAPAIFSPEDGSIFDSDTVELNWRSNGTALTRYWLYAGSSNGARDYLSRSMDLATTYTLTGLPTDGSDVYIRLWYYSGGWRYTDHRYNATGGSTGQTTVTGPELLEPVPNSILKRSEVTFKWRDNTSNPENYWMYIGTTAGSANIHSSGGLGTVNEYTFSSIPLDSDVLYVRLWHYTSANGWLFTDYSYTSTLYGGSQIISPEPGSLIDSADQEFEWVANGEAVQDYQLLLGSSEASNDLYDSGLLTASTFTHAATGIDTRFQPIHVTLRHRVNGAWQENYYRYNTPSSDGFDEDFNADISRWTAKQGVWYNADLQRLSSDVGDDWSMAYYNASQFSDLDYSARLRRSDSDDQPTFLSIRNNGENTELDCWCANDGCYTFEISPAQNYAVWSCKGLDWVQLQPLTKSDFINPGTEWNEMRVLAEGDDLSFYINGNLAWQGTDSTHSSGSVGLGLVNFEDSAQNTLDVEWARLTVPGASTNLATSGVATQQSLDYGGIPERAIDGNTSGAWRDGSVTHTARVTQPWWQVDLGQQSLLETVKIYNRTDCCTNRLSNVHVFVSDSDMSTRSLTQLQADSAVTSYFIAGALSQVTEQALSNVKGRYLRIQLNGRNFLSLAEVEVIGR